MRVSARLRHALAALTCATAVHLVMAGSLASQPGRLYDTISFDIPSQPLARALEAYVATAGLEVFYDSDLASGRRSTAVTGRLVADVALRVLLEGTDLAVVYTESAFSVVPAASGSAGVEAPGGGTDYFALIQGRIEQAFCRHTETIPGSYRLAVKFRIGTGGEVLQPQLLSTTGSAARDGTIAAVLGGINTGRAPPAGMPQPIVMLVKPLPRSQTGDCRDADHRASVQP